MNIQHSASTSDHELAAGGTAANRARRSRLFASPSLPMALVAATALLALMIGVALPPLAVETLFEEGGFVENVTVIVYAFAIVAIGLARNPHFSRSSTAAGMIV